MDNKDYLKTPEHFKELVQAKVNEQLNEGEQTVKNQQQVQQEKTELRSVVRSRRFRWGRVVAVVVVTVLAVGTTAFAAWNYRLSNVVPQGKENYVETMESENITVENGYLDTLEEFEMPSPEAFNQPLLKLTEIYYDGVNLYLYGVATEEGKDYNVGTSRVIINGKQYIGDLHRTSGQGSMDGFNQDEYIGVFNLDGEVGNNFTVELPLSIYINLDASYVYSDIGPDGEATGENHLIHINNEGKYTYTIEDSFTGELNTFHYDILTDEEKEALTGKKGEQTISFDVTADNRVISCEDQYQDLSEDVSVSATNIKKTAAGIRMNLKWHLSSEAAEQYADGYHNTMPNSAGVYLDTPVYRVTDNQGTVYDANQIDLNYQATIEDIERPECVIENDDGSVDCYSKILIRDMPQDVTAMTIQWMDGDEGMERLKVEIMLE